MQYSFSVGWFFVGLLVTVAGVLFVRFYQQIADNLGSGVASYERYKMWAFITCGVGIIVMLNLHTFILGLIFHSIFPSL